MALYKYLKIYLCGLCHHCGRTNDGFSGCNYSGKFVAFEDQEPFADIPDWCPLPNAPKQGEEKILQSGEAPHQGGEPLQDIAESLEIVAKSIMEVSPTTAASLMRIAAKAIRQHLVS